MDIQRQGPLDYLPGVPETIQKSRLESEGRMREIPLTQGKVALVDDEDFERINQFKWFAAKQRNDSFYAMRNNPNTNRLQPMTRFILGIVDPKCHTDHINHNTLDNRRENIRVCTHRQNQQNLKNKQHQTPTGVSIERTTGHFTAHIKIDGKLKHLGTFKTEDIASQAYIEAVHSLGLKCIFES